MSSEWGDILLLDHQGKSSAVQKTNIYLTRVAQNTHTNHALTKTNRIYEDQEAFRLSSVWLRQPKNGILNYWPQRVAGFKRGQANLALLMAKVILTQWCVRIVFWYQPLISCTSVRTQNMGSTKVWSKKINFVVIFSCPQQLNRTPSTR